MTEGNRGILVRGIIPCLIFSLSLAISGETPG